MILTFSFLVPSKSIRQDNDLVLCYFYASILCSFMQTNLLLRNKLQPTDGKQVDKHNKKIIFNMHISPDHYYLIET